MKGTNYIIWRVSGGGWCGDALDGDGENGENKNESYSKLALNLISDH